MRLLNDKKGQVRIIEAFLASALLMTCLTLIPSQPNVKGPSEDLAATAQNVLLSLDSNGHLAVLVDNRNWTALKDSLESALPLTVWFNLTVFDKQMNILNDYPICNGGAVSDKIFSIDYVCASQNSTYTTYILRLQLSQVGLT
jgi:hypothetical protein